MNSAPPLLRATNAAMRDAAAKFLVQFPEQPAGQRLAKNEPIEKDATVANTDNVEIGVVPIDDPPPEAELEAAPSTGAPDVTSSPTLAAPQL